MASKLRRATAMLHRPRLRSEFGETSDALFLTASFSYASGEEAEPEFGEPAGRYCYTRVGNPTVHALEERWALLQGSEAAIATASGMAAVQAALLAMLKAGDRLVASRPLFGSCMWLCTDLLPRFGVEVEFVDAGDLAGFEAALSRPAALVLIETPANPTLDLIDIQAVAALAHAAGARLVVDDALASPICQNSLELGADLVVTSATKHADGQGRVLGGLIACDRHTRDEILHPFIKHTGPNLSPFNAWVLLKSLETIELRVLRMAQSAGRIATFLQERGNCAVRYPGLPGDPFHALASRQMHHGGTLLTLRTGGGKQGAFDFLRRLEVIEITNNLGDSRTIATHPATTTHGRLPQAERIAIGIHDDLIRLSVGLEDPEDLIEDLDRALG
ncbi:MAG TPA: aminotransferase class I/II-fold pyridoxal phosphate-dependent enzyme [Geminicoccus sp.]|uniref:trans-sulfuration enzyme family protein n=1 Tax=Geminicoccus sp. TaxID=2024832 RepID=UPI002CFC6B58|nr:aminotransferase class I/II-fold pyridoxal phosphate-dependent enzyme [Geminicoccus sp.]HWL67220.1 aminotransferase class I/II-fold pyridoxal phosphate-dependent enzyme [Geminicoccus sp.]